EKILKWLNPPDCTINFQVADDKRTGGTGQWILDHPEYIKWKQSPNVLWIQGKAGSGKTILTTTIIRDLEQGAPENVWYHYFDSRDNTDQKSTFRGYLLSFLLRVGANSIGIHPALKKLFDKCSRQGLSGSSPTVKDLAMVLKEVFVTVNWGYIVLDAMDECSEPSKVLGWLQDLPKQYYILFTSRYRSEGEISRECLEILLDSKNAKIDEDIAIYLKENIKQYKFERDLRAEVINTLKEKAQGQFRWVDCQLRALEDCGGIPRTVREALADLPEDLEQTYNQAMNRTVKKRTRKDAHNILLWLLYSFEPLTVEMIKEILAIDLKNSSVEKANGTNAQIYVIIDSTLVAVDIHSNVQLAHASVKEFLINQYNSSHTTESFLINELLAHKMIAQTCIIYLMEIMQSIDRGGVEWVIGDYPLGKYAVTSWIRHVKHVECKDNQSDLYHKIGEFVTSGMPSFQKWVQVYKRTVWIERAWDGWGGKYGSALMYAVAVRNKVMVNVLIEKGADPNAQGGQYGHALLDAIAKEDEDIVNCLLEKGANPNAQGGQYGSALMYAIDVGNEALVNVLIEKGADLNAQGGKYDHVLLDAIDKKNEAIVNHLLEKGANPNAQGGQYGSALMYAIAVGNEAIVDILLEKGADPNTQGGRYGHVLLHAIAKKNEAIVKCLLKKGANPNAQGGRYGYALLNAIAKKNKAIGGRYGHVLFDAIAKQNEAIVNCLLEKGANPNAQGNQYGSALMYAIAVGNKAIVNLLIEKGASPNAQGGQYGHVLLDAIATKNEAIVICLLEKGANPNAQGGKYGSALMYAVAIGNEAMVNVLLEKGADPNAHGGQYGHALLGAVVKTNEAIVNCLLEKGANPNAQGGKYGSALLYAVAVRNEAIVNVLLEKGAD
ncbi:hypothetical protein GYMLUDRAFT_140091, partial [Collybiopsis luxurians FD-317 M1]